MEDKRKDKVWLFFLIAFGWAWLFWVPLALAENGVQMPEGLLNFLGGPQNPAAWGPLLAAFAVTYFNEKGVGLRRLISRGIDVKLGLKWYLAALLIFPLVLGVSYLAAGLSEESVPPLEAFQNPVTIPFAFLFIFFLGGPLQEEFGWRGYAQIRLQERWNALSATVLVGFLWGLWHLPLVFISRQEAYYNRPVWGLILSTILVSFVITWIHNNTGGSVFAAMLAHTAFNWSNFLFPSIQTDVGGLVYFGLLILIAVGIVVFFGTRKMVREGEI